MKQQPGTVIPIVLSLAGLLSAGALCWGDCMCSTGNTCSADCTYACGPTFFSCASGGINVPAGCMTTQIRCKTYSTGASYNCGPGSTPPSGTLPSGCSAGFNMCCGQATTDPGTPDPLGLIADVPVTGAYQPCDPPGNG
jgi:hypothetical protein